MPESITNRPLSFIGSCCPSATRWRSAELCGCLRRVRTDQVFPSAASFCVQRQPLMASTVPESVTSLPLQSVGS